MREIVYELIDMADDIVFHASFRKGPTSSSEITQQQQYETTRPKQTRSRIKSYNAVGYTSKPTTNDAYNLYRLQFIDNICIAVGWFFLSNAVWVINF